MRNKTRDAKEMSKEIRIIDITDKKELLCPNCGFLIDIPPRTMSMNKLRHMQAVKWFSEWKKKQNVGHGIGNVRLLICPVCEQACVCKDRFSIEY